MRFSLTRRALSLHVRVVCFGFHICVNTQSSRRRTYVPATKHTKVLHRKPTSNEINISCSARSSLMDISLADGFVLGLYVSMRSAHLVYVRDG